VVATGPAQTPVDAGWFGDLTEETEEIILKRQKFAVESSEYFLETSKQTADLTLKTSLPRDYDGLRTAKRDQDLAAGYAEETFTRTLAKKRLDLEKTKRDQKKAEKRLAAKRADYFAAGTLAQWDVDLLSDEPVRVYRASDPAHPTVYRRGEIAEAEPAVRGWQMLVDELFD
jgi:hypothetical protein